MAASPVPAAVLSITNGDFSGALVAGTNVATVNNPSDWTVVEPTSHEIYAQSNSGSTGTGAFGSVLHFKDGGGSTTASYIQQDLSGANAGLTSQTYGGYTVNFDLGWRTDTNTFNDAVFLVSLINSADNSVLASQTITLTSITTSNYNGLSTATPGVEFARSISLTYDNAAVTSGDVILRIARTDTFDSGSTGSNSTSWLDNVAVTAVPEPSAYGLIGAGALASVAMVRRRRKKSFTL